MKKWVLHSFVHRSFVQPFCVKLGSFGNPVNPFGLGQNARTTGGAGILPAASLQLARRGHRRGGRAGCPWPEFSVFRRATYPRRRGDAVPTGTITLRNRLLTLPLGVSNPASTKMLKRSSCVRVRSQAEVFFHASAMSKLVGRFAFTEERMA